MNARDLPGERPGRASGASLRDVVVLDEDTTPVHVFDAYGTTVWSNTNVPSVSGPNTVSVPYGGPALRSGSLYQFRAVAIKNGGSAIAMTEDLKGVFLYK